MNITTAQAIKTFGTNDLAGVSRSQLEADLAEVNTEIDNRTANNLDIEDQQWRRVRIAAALDRI